MHTICCHDSCLMNEQSNMLTKYSFLIIFFYRDICFFPSLIELSVIDTGESLAFVCRLQLLLAFLLLLVSLLLFLPCCCRRLPTHMLADVSDVVGIPAVASFLAVAYVFALVGVPAVLLSSLPLLATVLLL